MLTRVRIEVEEETAEACVEALWKYEHAIQIAEARRYVHLWPVTVTEPGEGRPDEPMEPIDAEEQYGIREHPWSDDNVPRSFFNSELGREVAEEVIEYDESIPGYKGRRVVRFARLDTRHSTFLSLDAFEQTANSGASPGSRQFLKDVVATVDIRQ